MTIIEAFRTGRRFRRRGWPAWWPKDAKDNFSQAEIMAEDWEVEPDHPTPWYASGDIKRFLFLIRDRNDNRVASCESSQAALQIAQAVNLVAALGDEEKWHLLPAGGSWVGHQEVSGCCPDKDYFRQGTLHTVRFRRVAD